MHHLKCPVFHDKNDKQTAKYTHAGELCLREAQRWPHTENVLFCDNVPKVLMEIASQELKGSVKTLCHQVEKINKEIQITEKNKFLS